MDWTWTLVHVQGGDKDKNYFLFKDSARFLHLSGTYPE